MNTEQFMLITGIKHKSYLHRYAKRGILQPRVFNGVNDYSDEDVQRYLAYTQPEECRKFEKDRFEQLENRLDILEAKYEVLEGVIKYLTEKL